MFYYLRSFFFIDTPTIIFKKKLILTNHLKMTDFIHDENI